MDNSDPPQVPGSNSSSNALNDRGNSSLDSSNIQVTNCFLGGIASAENLIIYFLYKSLPALNVSAITARFSQEDLK